MILETMTYDAGNGIARITLNRPERLNAISAVMTAELRQAVQQATDDHAVKVVVLSGSGRAFCAGYDLDRGTKAEDATQKSMAGSEYPVEHLVYSDGLATVSVFIENPNSRPEVAAGFSRVGSSNAFSLSLNGRQVTAVGEVPMRTVETIATSLTAR